MKSLNKTQPAAVILGANFYIALGAIRSLGRKGVKVFALDYNFRTAYALSSKYVTEKVLFPNINCDESAVAQFLIEFGKRFSERPVLLASADNYAVLLSRYAGKLAPYYRFPPNKPGLLESVINKKKLYTLAQQHNLRMPLTYFPESDSDVDEIASGIRYPCIIKPALSHKFVKLFRQKCLIINQPDTLVKFLKQSSAAGLEVMVQEIIPGFDDQMYVFDVYINQEGRPTHTFTAQKLRQFPVNFGSSTFTRQFFKPELIELGLEYMRRLDYRGFGEIEFKRHAATGELYMIEINARLSSLNALYDACGVEFTYAMYRDLTGHPLPDYHLQENRPWAFWHSYEDFFSVCAYLKKKQLGIKQIIKPWLSYRKCYAIRAADDIKPLFAFGRIILGRLAGKIRRLFATLPLRLLQRIKVNRAQKHDRKEAEL